MKALEKKLKDQKKKHKKEHCKHRRRHGEYDSSSNDSGDTNRMLGRAAVTIRRVILILK